ncbi:signal peptidase I [Nocardioides carbamazepini]|uniref:signal peptidase I n=1 Tax=Nocardioides carbamazepini TaxID=2854259 RepID=UPI00214A3723|nr:signal peptidase I [Nocardioides carbamazepini]MCR1783097.1 signal peptidase I [Nocardioides carbamazepini]
MRSVISWVTQVVVWLVLLLIAVALAAAVLVPRIAGGTPYTVLTGSMEPDYPPGALVVVKPVAVDRIRIGDVITYQRASGRSTVVTHRVVGVGSRLDGEKAFTTQGDANDAPDPAPVREVQIKGWLWYSVPYLGYVNNALTGRQRQVAVLVVSTGLVGYATFMFVGAVRDRRRGRRVPAVEEPPAGTAAGPAPADRARTPELHTAAGPAAPTDRSIRRDAPVLVMPVTFAVAALLLLTWRRTRRRTRRRDPIRFIRRTKEGRP